MIKRLLTGLITIAATILPGCDALFLDEFKPGITTSAEVEKRMGRPAAEYSNADGSITEVSFEATGIELTQGGK